MKHILVTGGSGFIGSHLCEVLLSKGYAVTALDNLLTGRKSNIESILKNSNFLWINRDVCQPILDKDIPFIAQHGLYGIFHFACPASPIDFEKIPFEILEVDSLGTMTTVDLAFRHGSRYLLASTSEIYGDPLVHPQKEDYWGNVSTTGPRACYDETKRFAEAYVTSAMRGSGTYKGKKYEPLNAAIVRIFNTYGPRMRPDDGRVVPELCMQGLKGQEMTIHGDGSQTRSFCFVSDLVNGIVKLFESSYREPFNIGNPVERSIKEFADVVMKLTGSKAKMKSLSSRPDDPRKRCPDISKARKLLDWEPKVSLEEGLSKCLEDFRQYL